MATLTIVDAAKLIRHATRLLTLANEISVMADGGAKPKRRYKRRKKIAAKRTVKVAAVATPKPAKRPKRKKPAPVRSLAGVRAAQPA